MKNKFWSMLFITIFTLAFFTSLRIIAIYWYHLQHERGNYTLAMALMDKANIFNMTSYITGVLHGWVVGIIILIICDR